TAGWGYDDVLPIFKLSERWCGAASPFHGTDGPLDVRDVGPCALACEAFVAAAEERLGVARNDDFNGAEQEGVGRYQYTVRNGRRWSAADAFLHPARTRPNLEVVSNARVVGLNVKSGRVEGVRYVVGKTEKTATAAKEVVLSSGAIGTPHILLHSGIGPASHLQSVGIPVLHDLPGVGENLQDHLLTVVQLKTIAGGSRTYNLLASLGWLLRYAVAGTGPLTQPPVHTGGFVRTEPGQRRPNLQ